MKFKATVLGASGFGGGEVIRLLEAHPRIDVAYAGAASQAGKHLGDLYPWLGSSGRLPLVPNKEAVASHADVVFCSVPHGQSASLLSNLNGTKIIDLGGDFRLRDPAGYQSWYGEEHPVPKLLSECAYGLTELNRDEIKGAGRVANPGCYAAAALLALGPLLENDLVETDIHIDAKSGISGAGRASGNGIDFAHANENARPYQPTRHNHIPEIEQELSRVAGKPVEISFVPHLIPMSRGILVTAVAGVKRPAQSALQDALQDRYRDEPFVRVLSDGALPETKRLSGTNFAEVAVAEDARTGKALAFAALDNLGKGAAGQAIQNANLMLGLPETMGLLQAGSGA